jgi:branched-chain amino acid transport system ATP-binding protein
MALLEVSGLCLSFGGVQAVQTLDFCVERGGVHSIIGPNGAGKTSVFNLVTGLYRPTAGRVVFEGSEVTGRRPYELAWLGLSRTFQNLQICFNMSAVENVMVGAHLRLEQGLLRALLRPPSQVRADRTCRDEALRLIEFVGLWRFARLDAGSMPYGALKRLEIARALAARPKLLLLDEPAAGLNPTEMREIDGLIKKIAATGVTVVLVEHDMKLVMGLSDHIVVLDHGRKLAEGTAAEVRADPAVIAAYLGAAAVSSP